VITRVDIKASYKFRNDMGQLFIVDKDFAKGTIAFIRTLYNLEIVKIKSDPWLNGNHYVVEFIHE
jgi:hypothetical protein